MTSLEHALQLAAAGDLDAAYAAHPELELELALVASKPIHGTNSKAPPPSIGARRATSAAAAAARTWPSPTRCSFCGVPLGSGPLVAAYLETPWGARCCAQCPACLCRPARGA